MQLHFSLKDAARVLKLKPYQIAHALDVGSVTDPQTGRMFNYFPPDANVLPANNHSEPSEAVLEHRLSENPEAAKPIEMSSLSLMDFEANRVLLYAVQLPEIYHRAAELLTPEDFCVRGEEVARAIWVQLKAYTDANQAAPTAEWLASTVVSMITNTRAAIDPDDAEGLVYWLYSDQGELRAADGIEVLKRFAVERGFVAPVRMATQIKDPASIAKLHKQAVEVYQKVQETAQSQSVQLLGDERAEYQQRLNLHRGRHLIGLRTGMQILDDRTCGIRFNLFGAAPGMGKSVYCLQIGTGVCRYSVESDNAAVVLYLSLDMNADDVRDRLFCYLAGMDWKSYRLGSENYAITGKAPGSPTPIKWC